MSMKTHKLTVLLGVTTVSAMSAAGCSTSGTAAHNAAASGASTVQSTSAVSTTPSTASSRPSSTPPSPSTHSQSPMSTPSSAKPSASYGSRSHQPSSPARSSVTSSTGSPVAAPTITPTTQKLVLNSLPGSSKAGSCVDVGAQRDVRSGTMAVGNFQAALKSFKSQYGHSPEPTVNLYVIPAHRSMPGAHVTLTPVTTKGKTVTTKSTSVESADVWQYYSVQLSVPASGTWRLKVSSGPDSGCFTVSFPR